MVAVAKIEIEVEVAKEASEPVSIEAQRAAADAWALALADALWNDPVAREAMCADFQKVVDKMVEVRFGNAAVS
jgi:hypothetical protein